jgi:hypothetical protein
MRGDGHAFAMAIYKLPGGGMDAYLKSLVRDTGKGRNLSRLHQLLFLVCGM